MNTEEKMNLYFKEGKFWSYSDPTTIEAAFGPFLDFPRVGRDTQVSEIWTDILRSNLNERTKFEALYLHGSPGLGKTYLLRKIFSKQDYPIGYAEAVKAVKFLALDFGRNACGKAKNYKKYFVERPNLLALSRLFYVNFAVQSELEWVDFLGEAVVPIIQAGLASKLVKMMKQQFKTFKGESRCDILVDEIMKTEELGVGFAERVRSKVCGWMEDRLCNAVYSQL